MKILSATFNDFKRFKKLEIKSLPSTTKMVILVGPNGSGKSSVLDGFLQWYRKIRFGPNEEQMAYYMRGLEAWKNRQSVYQNQIVIEFNGAVPETWDGRKDLFYFRSAYRFEGSFTLDSISRFDPIEEDQRIAIMSDSDVSVSKNYARLVGKIVADLHDTSDDNVSKGKWREAKYKPLQESLQRLFPDLTLDSPGNPLEDGTFFFSKGDVKRFRYGNLSSGEKSVLDLILDLYVRGTAFKEGIFCIDEPEAHMNTNLHGTLLEELYRFVPDQGQLWVATHSIGMIRKAAELNRAQPGSVVFLDFHDLDFDHPVVLLPARVNTSFWSRNLRTTLAAGPFSSAVAAWAWAAAG